MTKTETKLTAEAAEIIDIALDGGTFTAWFKVVPNRWGGFDITGRSQIIRVTQDDGQWAVALLTDSGVEFGRQTFAGCFASLHLVGMTVQGLL